MSTMFEEYESAYPPASFYQHEATGQQTLTPRGGEPPAATFQEPVYAAQGALPAPTRALVDSAIAGLASALGVPSATVREAMLELTAADPNGGKLSDYGNVGFSSLTDEMDAMLALAGQVGVSAAAPGFDAAEWAEQEASRIAATAPAREFHDRRTGERRIQFAFDPARRASVLRPAPAREFSELPMTDHQAGEVLRLSGTDMRRPHYGAMALAANDAEREQVELSGGAYDEAILQLAEDGSTSPYSQGDARSGTNGSSYTEVEVGYDSEVSTEVDRLLQVARDKGIVGTGLNQESSGNMSYSPAAAQDQSQWGQRTRPGAPWFSG